MKNAENNGYIRQIWLKRWGEEHIFSVTSDTGRLVNSISFAGAEETRAWRALTEDSVKEEGPIRPWCLLSPGQEDKLIWQGKHWEAVVQ